MEPTLTWLDLTATDRNQMRRVLDLFREQGTVDEMGLGTLRDALSDALFPGTSTIQTRLRYMLFVPWIYQGLERRRVRGDEVAERARKAELKLIEPLLAGAEDEGVIGARSRGSLKRLPSDVYWSGLVRWGIFKCGQSQSWYHTHFEALARGGHSVERTDDPGLTWSQQPTWHPHIPEPPDSFPHNASFALEHDEAVFLQERIADGCAGTLLAWLAGEGADPPSVDFWDDPAVAKANTRIQEVVELARRFSLHVEGMPLLYNLLVAERHRQEFGGEEGWIDRYRENLAAWEGREAKEPPYDPSAMWDFVGSRRTRLPEKQRRFVEGWSHRLVEIGVRGTVDDGILRNLVANREMQLKGRRARLANSTRLLHYNGRVGVGRMDFRWFRVRRLLIDLHQGLAA